MSRYTVTETVLAPVVALLGRRDTSAAVALDSRTELQREWDELRATATSSQERAEIDAIFGRYAA